MKMAICAAILSPCRKFLRRRRRHGRGLRGEKAGRGLDRGSAVAYSVCLSVVCPLLDKLVRAAWADCDETFGAGQGHGQERLSLDQSRYGQEKGRKFKFRTFCPLKRQLFQIVFLMLYGQQMVHHAIWLWLWRCLQGLGCPLQTSTWEQVRSSQARLGQNRNPQCRG